MFLKNTEEVLRISRARATHFSPVASHPNFLQQLYNLGAVCDRLNT